MFTIDHNGCSRCSRICNFQLKLRLTEAIQQGVSRYPIFRTFQFSASGVLDLIFDNLALNLGFTAHRISSETLILDSENTLIVANGTSKKNYCSYFFELWSSSQEQADAARSAILSAVEHLKITTPMFTIDWHSISGQGELNNVKIEEKLDEILLDEAYPEIRGGVNSYIARYLESSESILVLYGPPGTGKTRLIRAILGEISRRKGENAHVVYTGDAKTIESDAIFIKFITGSADAFVVEDADYLLKSRNDGNRDLHRFLTIADGVAKSQGRKIIFSTNLPNLRDIDDALIRPGRCFDQLFVRNLSYEEASAVLNALCRQQSIDSSLAQTKIDNMNSKTYSLAEVYKTMTEANDCVIG